MEHSKEINNNDRCFVTLKEAAEYRTSLVAADVCPGSAYDSYEQVAEFPNLTIKRLKEIIKDLPDDMVVTTQRIEDFYFSNHHWRSVIVLWEQWNHRKDFTEVLPAFSAYVAPTELGKDMLVIHAHY